MRPSKEDSEALKQLLKREDVSDWEAEFLESLVGKTSWSEKQSKKFDELCDNYLGKMEEDSDDLD